MPRTVLIADESITIRSVAESLLRGESFSVHSAADGQMALEIARAERPDLALIGEKLSGLSGAEVCRTLKNDPELRTMPIIVMRADRPGASPEHADAVLTKPFSPQSLLDSVHRFLVVDSSKEGTAPVHLHEVSSPGLEEELIDSALGLDDVGPAPAEEREIAAPRPLAGFDGNGDPEAASPFGLVDDVLRDNGHQDSDEERMSKALDESFGLLAAERSQPAPEPEPAGERERIEFEATNRRDSDLDLDFAIDAAFGESPRGRAKSVPAAPNEPSSLNEVSLGDQSSAEFTGVKPPASSAAPGAGIDLGGSEIQEDRPHDYDWFIKEMQQDGGPRTDRPAPVEAPRIEPLIPLARAPKPAAPKSAPAPEPSRPGSSSRPYDEFISEFRAEIARIEGMAAPADALVPGETDRSRHSQSGKIAFEQTGEGHVPPTPPSPPATVEATVRAWGDELIDSVTSQVARELAAKIDTKVIYSLIEQKLKEAQKHRP